MPTHKLGTTEFYSDSRLDPSKLNLWSKCTHVRCACHDLEHSLYITQEIDTEDNPLYIEIFLSVHLAACSFWHRIRNAWLYIIGRRSRFGDFEEFVIDDSDDMRKIAEIFLETADIKDKAYEERRDLQRPLISWWFENRKRFWLVGPDAWSEDSITDDNLPNLTVHSLKCNISGLQNSEPSWYIEPVVPMRDVQSMPPPADAHNWYGPFNSPLAAIYHMRCRDENEIEEYVDTIKHIRYVIWEINRLDEGTYIEIYFSDETSAFDLTEMKTSLISRFPEAHVKTIRQTIRQLN